MVNKILFPVLIVIVWLSGCKPAPDNEPWPPPEKLRILSTVTAADHLLVQLKCADKIVALDRHGLVIPELKELPVAVAGGTVSREWLKKLRINMAIVWYYQQNLAAVLRREGVAVWVIEPLRIGNYPEFVREMGKLTGRSREAQALIDGWTSTFAPRKYARLKPCYIELYDRWRSAGQGAYLSEVLQLAGGVNALTAARDGVVSPEMVRAQNVEVIFYIEGFGNAEEIAARPALRNTPAVRDRRIYALPRNLASEGVAPQDLLKFFKERLEF